LTEALGPVIVVTNKDSSSGVTGKMLVNMNTNLHEDHCFLALKKAVVSMELCVHFTSIFYWLITDERSHTSLAYLK